MLLTEYKDLDIGVIKPYYRNNKNHSESQVLEIAESIRFSGMLSPLIVDEDFVILAGHGTFKACITVGMTTVPCAIHYGLSDRQKQAFRIADNKLAEKSSWNFENLAAEISELLEMNVDIDVLGFNSQEIENLLESSPGLLPDDLPKKTIEVSPHKREVSGKKNKRPTTIVGDVFILGGLILTCKDANSVANCDRVVRNWETITEGVAIHQKSGKSFSTLTNDRQKG